MNKLLLISLAGVVLFASVPAHAAILYRVRMLVVGVS
jgi:hypothetical protein